MSGFIDDRRGLSAAAARFARDCQYFTEAIEQGSEEMNARQKLAKTLVTFLTNATKIPAEMISSLQSCLDPQHGIDPTRQPPGSGSVAAESAPDLVPLAVLTPVPMGQESHKSILIADGARLTVTDILHMIYGGHLEGIKKAPAGTPDHLSGYVVSFSSRAAAEAFMAWTTTLSFRATAPAEHLFVRYEWLHYELNLSEQVLRAASVVGARCSIRILNFAAPQARTLAARIQGLFRTNGSFDIYLRALNEPRRQFDIVTEHIAGSMALKSWFDERLLGPEFHNCEVVYVKDPNEDLEVPMIAEDPEATTGGAAQNLLSNPAPPNGIQGNDPPPYSTMEGLHLRDQARTRATFLHRRNRALGGNGQGVAQDMEGPTASSRQVPGQATNQLPTTQLGRGDGNNVDDKSTDKGDRKDDKKVGGEKYGEKANEGKEESEEELLFFGELEEDEDLLR